MSKQVVVTRTEKLAAQIMVERLESTGRPVRESLRKIANAKAVQRPSAAAS